MRISIRNVFVCFLLAMLFTGVGFAKTKVQNNEKQIELFISPEGNDNNPGTEEQPLASLTGARNAVRKIKNQSQEVLPVVITIKDGRYEMSEPLILLPQDGGTEACPVVFKAEEGLHLFLVEAKRFPDSGCLKMESGKQACQNVNITTGVLTSCMSMEKEQHLPGLQIKDF